MKLNIIGVMKEDKVEAKIGPKDQGRDLRATEKSRIGTAKTGSTVIRLVLVRMVVRVLNLGEKSE